MNLPVYSAGYMPDNGCWWIAGDAQPHPRRGWLRALSQTVGAPVTELLRTLSYARVSDVLAAGDAARGG